jgi:hypothetical protein
MPGKWSVGKLDSPLSASSHRGLKEVTIRAPAAGLAERTMGRLPPQLRALQRSRWRFRR